MPEFLIGLRQIHQFDTTGRTSASIRQGCDWKMCVFYFNIAVRFKWDLSQASNVVMNLPDGRSWRLLAKGSGILSF